MNRYSILRLRWTLIGAMLIAFPAVALQALAQGHVRVVEVVKYEQLDQRVGQQIVVRTTLGSRRAGTLVRFTKTSLRLKLNPIDGGVELDIPSSSVRDVEVATESDPIAGAPSAKKN